nr:MAG TPA: hypothetical protein [Caudoviricetes sp.]
MTIKVYTSTIKTLEDLGYKVRTRDTDSLGQLYALEYNGFLYSGWMSANELNYFAAGAERAMHVFGIDPMPTDDSAECACDCEGKCGQRRTTLSVALDEAVDELFDYLNDILDRDPKADAQ